MRFAGGRCGEAQLGWGTPGDKLDDWIIGQLPRATLLNSARTGFKRQNWEKNRRELTWARERRAHCFK